MFKRLKRKFVMSNMLMISVVMLISFAVVYGITYNNIQNQNQLKIENAASATMRYMDLFKNEGVVYRQYPTKEMLQAFGVVINQNGDYVFDSASGMIDKTILLEAIHQVAQQKDEAGKIILSGRHYQYTFSQSSVMVAITSENSNAPSQVEEQYLITFLDITESEQTITQLWMTFIVIGGISLLAIFAISVHFAKTAVVPIEASYLKQKQFIQDASHELKTPLASISANLEVVNSNSKETVETQQKWIGYIAYELERMTNLVNDLLYLASTENAESAPSLSLINVSEIVEYATVSVEASLFEKNIEFSCVIEPNLTINGDPDKIEHVAKILLDNALKYTNVQGKIHVNLEARKNHVVLSIVNTGEGIPTEHMDRIFDRFYRVDTARQQTGSYGLGLAIAKALVDSMGGTITVSSVPSKDTTFTVQFNDVAS